MADQENSVRVKKIVTAAIYTTSILFGTLCYLIGPSRYDIADNVNSDLRGVSYGPMAKSAGAGIGALLSSFIMRRIRRQISHVIFLTLVGLSYLAVPFARHLWQYITAEFAFGLWSGVNGSNLNSWILEMWEEKSNPYNQGMHFMFSIGTVIAPLVAAPFLSDRNSTIPSEQESRIVIPFSIVSGLIVAVALSYILLYTRVPYIDSKRKMEKIRKEGSNVDDQKSKYYNIILITLSGLLVCSYTGIEISTMSYSATFIYNLPLGFTKVDAAHIASALSASFAVNRLVSIYVATRLKTKTMLYSSFVILTTGNMLLLFFANKSALMVWLAFLIIGKGHSCVYPCILSFVEERINVTTSVCSFFILSSCFSSLVTPVLLGRFLEQYPLVYVYVNLTGLGICSIVFVLILLLDRHASHKNHYEQIN